MKTSLAKKIFAVGSTVAMIAAVVPFVALAAQHTVGTNVLSNGTVYFINSSNQKQPYTSAGAFLSYGFNSWSNVVAATPEDLALPTGSFVPPMDGSLINDNGTVYLITNGQRAGFTSAPNFLGLGYSFSNVVNGDTSFMTSMAPISSTSMQHPVGTLVNQNGTVYLITQSGKMGIPSVQVFNSWGYSFNKVVPANSYDNSIAMSSGIMQAMVMGQLNPTGTGSTVTLPPSSSGAVNVMVDPSSPAAGSIAKGAKVTFSTLKFTAGSSPAQVNSLVVTRVGLSSDSDVTNIYLYDTASNTQLAVGSFNMGKVTFTGSPLFVIPANGSKLVTVKADMSTTATASDSIGYGVMQASDVNANGATVGGTFPTNGSIQTISAVSNLGALVVSSPQTVATTVNSGTTGTNLGYFQLAGSNQPLSVTYLKFTEIGSVPNNAIANLKLFNGATQVGSTVANMNADNTVIFDLSSSPLVIPSGQTVNLYLKGDVVGGANRNFQFTVQRTSDVNVMDTTYNTGIVVSLNTTGGTSSIPTTSTINQVSVNAGSATLAVDTSSPTGNIATGASNSLLGTFSFTAAGEDVRVSSITVTTTTSGTSPALAGGASDYLTNGKLVDTTSSTTAQVGSTQNLNINTAASGAATTTFNIPGYWVVPAGTTRKLSLYADTKSNLNSSGALLNAMIVNVGLTTVSAQGASSLQNVAFGTSTARNLTLTASSLAAAQNLSFASTTSSNPAGVGGQSAVRIGSFNLTSGSSEGANVTLLTITTGTVSGKLQNLKLCVGSCSTGQIGTVQGVLANATAYSFSPSSSLVVPAGGSVTVDVYADIISGAASGSITNAVNLSGVTATGAVSNNSITATGTSTSNGQNVYVATSGSLTTSIDAQTPTAAQIQQLPMGTPQQTLAVLNFAAGNAEPTNIQKIIVTDTETSGAQGDLSNFKLYVNGTQVGPTVPSESGSGTTGTITFNMQSNPLVVPANQNISVYVKADISPFPNATSGDSHTLGIATAATDVIAIGGQSGATITNVGTATANAGLVYKTALSISKDATSPSGVTGASSTQTVAIFNLTNAANPANQQATFMPSCAVAGASNSVITFTFSSGIAVTASTSRVFKIFKSTDLTNAIASATINTGATVTGGTWSGTLTFSCSGGSAQQATFTPTAAGWTTATVTAVSWTPQVINAGTTQQYVAQFDTSDVVVTNHPSFTLSIQTQGTNKVWYDGVSLVSTLNTLPLVFGTVSY